MSASLACPRVLTKFLASGRPLAKSRQLSRHLSNPTGLAHSFGTSHRTAQDAGQQHQLHGDAGPRLVASKHTSSGSSDSKPSKKRKEICAFAAYPGTNRIPSRSYTGHTVQGIQPRLNDKDVARMQWSYIRHQFSKSELPAVRREFNKWKRRLGMVQQPANPSSWPWRTSGQWLLELNNVAAMQERWLALDVETRRQKWPLVMLSTMHLCPDKVNLVLAATLDPLPPGYAISDALLFVARHLDLEEVVSARERDAKADDIIKLCAKLFELLPTGHVPVIQTTWGLLAHKLPVSHLDELYSLTKRAGLTLHRNTLLHFANKFATSASHKPTAFEMVKALATSGSDLNNGEFASIITTLLHCKADAGDGPQPGTPFVAKDALEFFIQQGLQPNVVHATALVDTLCQEGQVEEAIRIALLFSESGLRLDAKAWAVVFRGAKHSLRVDNIVRAFDVAKVADAPFIQVLNNALHSVFFFAEMESRSRKQPPPWTIPLFVPLLRLYAKRFDLEPLQWWLPEALPLLLGPEAQLQPLRGDDSRQHWDFKQSIVPAVDNFFSLGDGPQPRLQPTATTLAIMLRAYIKSLRNPYDLASFYTFFKLRLEEDDQRGEQATMLVKDQGSLVHDTFLMTMTEHRGLSSSALQVFGDMLQGTLQGGGTEAGRRRLLHPAPTVLTFTILLRGLFQQGDRMRVKQVVQAMREHGLEANLVTWNTLVRGYASMQDLRRTVASLQDMEAAGLTPDHFSLKAFGRLRNQDAALRMMEAIIDANREKLSIAHEADPTWGTTHPPPPPPP